MQSFNFSTPLLPSLTSSRRILLAGCGGGSDVFGALPIYFGLQRARPPAPSTSPSSAAAAAASSPGSAPFEIFLVSLTSADEKDVARHPSRRHGMILLVYLFISDVHMLLVLLYAQVITCWRFDIRHV
jgi:hypothetical protein